MFTDFPEPGPLYVFSREEISSPKYDNTNVHYDNTILHCLGLIALLSVNQNCEMFSCILLDNVNNLKMHNE